MRLQQCQQYFNQNEPKAHLKIHLYMFQVNRMSLFEGVVGSKSREVQAGTLIHCCTSMANSLRLNLVDRWRTVWTQVQVIETEWMKWTKIVFFQQVWLRKKQMSIFEFGSALCSLKCSVNLKQCSRPKMNMFYFCLKCWQLGPNMKR